jgi:hypothetical protein
MQLPFPTPKEIWGDYTVKYWDKHTNGRFGLKLIGLSSLLIHVPDHVSERVQREVNDIITQAKSGLATYDEVIGKISVDMVLSNNEIEAMISSIDTYGEMLAMFYKNRTEVKN